MRLKPYGWLKVFCCFDWCRWQLTELF
jgi:hypothetical protein